MLWSLLLQVTYLLIHIEMNWIVTPARRRLWSRLTRLVRLISWNIKSRNP